MAKFRFFLDFLIKGFHKILLSIIWGKVFKKLFILFSKGNKKEYYYINKSEKKI
jgi:hypothetical protein